MPLYELRCEKCGHEFEELVFRRTELASLTCPRCGAPQVSQLLSACAAVGARKGDAPPAAGCSGGSGAFR
jgi:putative FmdB family regulatory protein